MRHEHAGRGARRARLQPRRGCGLQRERHPAHAGGAGAEAGELREEPARQTAASSFQGGLSDHGRDQDDLPGQERGLRHRQGDAGHHEAARRRRRRVGELRPGRDEKGHAKARPRIARGEDAPRSVSRPQTRRALRLRHVRRTLDATLALRSDVKRRARGVDKRASRRGGRGRRECVPGAQEKQGDVLRVRVQEEDGCVARGGAGRERTGGRERRERATGVSLVSAQLFNLSA
mmetsp:Transcript_7970/g.32275  ORF Transcript_7970/g.32275 Transcript_7970/m.32275 type:complete len:233 (+) Transcript_7970:256-954(+)